MVTLLLNYNDELAIDPCYIKAVKDSSGELRWDALKLIKTIHDGDDGIFDGIGCDSGRIWLLRAEFSNIEIAVDAGFSGFNLRTKN